MKHTIQISALALSLVIAPVAGAAVPSATDTTLAQAQLDDARIVAIFDLANTADIETGKLAARLGSTKEVRDFGQMLVNAHEQVRKQGRDLAARLKVTPPSLANDQMAKDHAATMARLGALKGAEFDRAFLDHEVSFHAAVIDAVNKTLLPAIRNAELRELVVKVAPAFVAHMEGAKQLAAKK